MTRETARGGGGGGTGAGGGSSAGAGLHIVRFAPAKLNLTLAVLGRRDDGYHSLHSIMIPLLLCGSLTASASPAAAAGVMEHVAGPSDMLRVSGLPVSAAEDNLVLRAIAALRTALLREHPRARADLPPLSVRLVKRIPVAAGLGGGSSD